MTSRLRYLLGPVFVVGVLAVAGLSLFRDAIAAGFFRDVLAPNSPLALVLVVLDARVLLAFAVAIFAVAVLLYLFYLRREDPDRLVYGGRSVEALVPVYEDADAMHRAVEGLAASEYENLTVTIIPEPDDDASLQRARDLADEHDDVRYLVNDERQGSKAGALNTALEGSDADVVAMFDADQEPHPKLIPHGMAYLDEYDAARVRSLPRPEGGVLESMVYYEYLLLFFLPQHLVRFFLGLRFVGTRSVLVDSAVFEEVGLLEENHLTEDMDFTHACHQAGIDVRELFYYPCFEAPAHTLTDWWWQRVRWMTGHVAVGHSHIREWRNLVDPDFLGSLLSLVGTFAAGVVMATTVPKLALAAVASPLVVAAGLAGLYATVLATRAVDNRTTETTGYELSWLLMPVTFTLFGIVIVQALISYTLGREGGWYSVEKTA